MATVPEGPARMAPPNGAARPSGAATASGAAAATIPGETAAVMAPPNFGGDRTVPPMAAPEIALPSGPSTAALADGPWIATPASAGPTKPTPSPPMMEALAEQRTAKVVTIV